MTDARVVLRRRLGLGDAVVLGLGSMIGAGIFSALAPAAGVAASGLLVGLAVAGVVAYCNATSTARLAAVHPEAGGTYVYGTRQLGPFWGYAAGWSFVVGKTASCAAMALTFATYLDLGGERWIAAAAVLALTAVNYRGIRKAAWLTRVIVAITLAALASVVVACLTGGAAEAEHLTPFPGSGVHGMLQAAGLLFFAFAGYARIATLGEEVRDPARTIPRAVTIALAITWLVYATVAVAALLAAGPEGLAATASPLRAAVDAGDAQWAASVVRVGAIVASLGALLALILGVSRTTFAMARGRHLPRALAYVHPRFGVPVHAELAVCVVVVVLVVSIDLRAAIGFSSFGVLLYYAIANASAWSLRRDQRRPPRVLCAVGFAGCAVLAVNLPLSAVITGVCVSALGALCYLLTARAQRQSRAPTDRQ